MEEEEREKEKVEGGRRSYCFKRIYDIIVFIWLFGF